MELLSRMKRGGCQRRFMNECSEEGHAEGWCDRTGCWDGVRWRQMICYYDP